MKSALLFFLVCASTFAETNIIPTISIDGRTFTNAMIRKANATTVIVRDDSGFGSIAITNLPEPFRSRFLDMNEIASLQKRVDLARDDRAEKVKSSIATQRRIEGVEINGKWVSKHFLEEVHARVEEIDSSGIQATLVILRPYYSNRINSLQRSGAAISYTPSPSGYTRDYRQSVLIRNGPKDAAIGSEIAIAAKKVGVQNGIEIWDCGTIPK